MKAILIQATAVSFIHEATYSYNLIILRTTLSEETITLKGKNTI